MAGNVKSVLEYLIEFGFTYDNETEMTLIELSTKINEIYPADLMEMLKYLEEMNLLTLNGSNNYFLKIKLINI